MMLKDFTVQEFDFGTMPIKDVINKVEKICKDVGVKHLDLFGSFATGTASPRSDIDFVVYGNFEYSELEKRLEKVETLRKIDIFYYNEISNVYLKEDIRKYGRRIY